MGRRLVHARSARMRLAGAVALLWPLAVQAAGEPTIVVEADPPPPVVIAAPADPAPAVPIEAPDLPQVVVRVPAPEPSTEPLTSSPMRTAEAAPRSAAQLLAVAIGERLADPALPLPPRFGARDREGLAAAYASGAPLWIEDGRWTPRAEAVLERLSRAGEDGLDPQDYLAPRLAAAPGELAEAELRLSAAAYLYARDARGGRLEPSRLGALITPKLDIPGVERVIATLAASDDPGAALEAFNPRYPGYAALRDKLAELRARTPGPAISRARTGTRLAALGTPPAPRISPRLEADILANMERWRWLPSQVGERYILVNVPEFRLRLVADGRTVHEARVITGRPETPTPVFSDLMDHAVVNPSWFVPPSILKKMDVGAAARSGYEVRQRRGVTSVRMPPGPRNALGNVKFMFPNDHAVYLHDTPNRGLFGASNRALSHGCVRVEHPFALGGRILGPQWSEGRLRSLIGSGERTIRLEERLPIHLAYFTLDVDEYGELRGYGDLYGYHGRVRRALGLGG